MKTNLKKIFCAVLFAVPMTVSATPEVTIASDTDGTGNSSTKDVKAKTKPYSADASSYEEKYFSGKDYQLSQLEREALKISNDFKNRSAQSKPIAGKAGEIIYVYGSQSLDIVCAVLQVCDIALQPGEQINTLHLGDSSRWYLEPAVTGSGSDEIQHIIVKPLDVGLKTSLVVTTNRRTYHMNLGSHKTQFMPLVSFTYPDEIQNKFLRLKNYQDSVSSSKVLPDTGESIENLDFDYTIDSNGQSWTPVRVYNNGRQTVIELPSNVSSGEIPTFTVQDAATEENVMVNYRYIGNKFIVDSLFRRAVLIVGVGSNQQKVTITKK